MTRTPRGQWARHARMAIPPAVAILVALMILAAGCGQDAGPTPTIAGPAPTDTAPADTSAPDPTIGAAGRARRPVAPEVTVTADGTLSWAYLDRTTGQRYQSDNAAGVSYTESMVKAWLAADALTLAAANGIAADYDLLTPMIRDSDDNAAEIVWLNNGDDASIYRMIQTCGLVDTLVYSGWWSMTEMSTRDAVNLGACIVDGTAAGVGTDWLLNEMRQVRGEGRFGIIDAVADPASVAIKNGWTLHYDDGLWRVNCLAISPDWILAVMTTYPGTYDLAYGANLCTAVTNQLLSQTDT